MLVAWCASATYALVTREADRAFPDETGGVFMGYWVRPRFEVVVTDVVGPGPEAVHDPSREPTGPRHGARASQRQH